MKSSPVDSRFWGDGFSSISETDSVSMKETFLLSLCHTVVNCTKILMFHEYTSGNLISSFLWRSGTSSIEPETLYARSELPFMRHQWV